jgi:hypothetical protein
MLWHIAWLCWNCGWCLWRGVSINVYCCRRCLCPQRLREKGEEWKAARAELNKGWKDELEKNYPKSLDHRSFYFKQADKKQITAKALLAQSRATVEDLRKKQEPNPCMEVRGQPMPARHSTHGAACSDLFPEVLTSCLPLSRLFPSPHLSLSLRSALSLSLTHSLSLSLHCFRQFCRLL